MKWMSRFDDMPGRLRAMRERLESGEEMDATDLINLGGILEDAALVIEARERVMKRYLGVAD